MSASSLADEAAVYEELGRWIMRTNAEVEAIHRVSRERLPSEPAPQRRPLTAVRAHGGW